MRRGSVAIVAVLVVLLVSGCRGSSERRLVSLRESKPVDDVMTGQVVYAQTEGIRRSGLYVREMSSGKARRLRTGFDGYVNAPAWAPDGTQVAYSAADDTGQHLWTVPVQGGQPTQLTSNPDAIDDNPRWSPDGRQLVFQSIPPGEHDWHLYVLEVGGGPPQPLPTPEGHSVFPDWSPDGRYVVYSHRKGGRYSLRLLDLTTRQDRPLGRTETEDLHARWAGDGRSIVYAGADSTGLFQLFRMQVPSGETERILGSDSADQFPSLSPDGRWVVFSSGYLSVYDSDGGKLPNGKLRWRLTQNLAWSPDWRGAR